MKRVVVPLVVTFATTGMLFGMVAFHANAAATPKGPHFPTTSALQPPTGHHLGAIVAARTAQVARSFGGPNNRALAKKNGPTGEYTVTWFADLDKCVATVSIDALGMIAAGTASPTAAAAGQPSGEVTVSQKDAGTLRVVTFDSAGHPVNDRSFSVLVNCA